MNEKSIRDYGLIPGIMQTGERNTIADVPGVTVGHATIDNERHKTGVTVILPAQDNLFTNKMAAAGYVINGFGKTLGFIQLDELGVLETPIALTGTLNVGKVHEGLVAYSQKRCAEEGVQVLSVNPLVGETNDAYLNDVTERAVGTEEVFEAIENASQDFEQGDVGAGKGTFCYGFKGGIGSASRVVTIGSSRHIVGALVQSNFGITSDFTPAGIPLGPIMQRLLNEAASLEDKGSIMMILGTDIPMTSRQLKRLCKRAAAGLVRTGSILGHNSGDVVMAFSTANRFPIGETDVYGIGALNERYIDTVFRAAEECVEEGVLNSMTHADTVRGNGHVRFGAGKYLERALEEFRSGGIDAWRSVKPQK